MLSPSVQPIELFKNLANGYKNTIRSSFLSALLFFLIFLLITFALPPWVPKQSYFGELELKLHTLKHTDSPKIIFVGGSNLAYGLDSNAIEKALGVPVVNMGFVLSLGLRYNLELIKDEIKAGDIVVISPEYGTLNWLVDGDSVVIEVTEVNPFCIKFVLQACAGSAEYTANLLKAIIFYPAKKWRELLTMIDRIHQSGHFDLASLKPEGPRKYYFDRHGDFFLHLIFTQPGNFAYQDPVVCISDEAADLLNRFNSLVQARYARVVIIPPPLPLSYPSYLKLAEEKEDIWPCKKIDIPILSRPRRYRFPLDDFYEIPYHLNLVGRTKRTKMVIEDLRRYLNNPGDPTYR
jgi:hypothetical protein